MHSDIQFKQFPDKCIHCGNIVKKGNHKGHFYCKCDYTLGFNGFEYSFRHPAIWINLHELNIRALISYGNKIILTIWKFLPDGLSFQDQIVVECDKYAFDWTDRNQVLKRMKTYIAFN